MSTTPEDAARIAEMVKTAKYDSTYKCTVTNVQFVQPQRKDANHVNTIDILIDTTLDHDGSLHAVRFEFSQDFAKAWNGEPPKTYTEKAVENLASTGWTGGSQIGNLPQFLIGKQISVKITPNAWITDDDEVKMNYRCYLTKAPVLATDALGIIARINGGGQPAQQPVYQPQQPAYAQQQPAYAQQQPAYQPQQPVYQPQQPYVQGQPSTTVNGQVPQFGGAPLPQSPQFGAAPTMSPPQ